MHESPGVEPPESQGGLPGEPVAAPASSAPDYSHAHMHDLVRIYSELTSSLDLPQILQRIVELGRELLEARYAAIAVVGQERGIKDLIHTGMEQEAAALVDRIQRGSDPLPDHLTTASFLGVPIRVHHALYGTLYVVDRRRGPFSRADQELAEALASAAGIAIQNARVFDASLHRATWSAALADLARQPVEIDDECSLGRIVEEVRDQACADLAFVAHVTAAGDVVVDRAAGPDSGDLGALSFPLDPAVLAEAATLHEPVLTEGIVRDEPGDHAVPALFGPTMVLSFPRHIESLDVLVVCRESGRAGFGPRDTEMAEAFAALLDASSQRRELQLARQRVAVLEDRGRIARDLHDHVIQNLFATGLNLEEIAARADEDIATRIGTEIHGIDAAIAQIRQSIFQLRHEPTTSNLRTRILQIVDHLTGHAPGTTQLVLTGPVGSVISGTCRDDVVAVVTEAVGNVVRHARASKVDIAVTAADGIVRVEVADDGIGPGDSPRISGLANLRRRAEARGGTFGLHARPEGGTTLVWSVPI